MRWQDFEEEVRKICEAHGFSTHFRFVFSDAQGKAEIDVVAERFDILICFDAKLYSASRYRLSQLKREAEKHKQRCNRLSAIKGKTAIPVIVTLIDDGLRLYSGCLFVPFHSLNDFLTNLHYYLAELQFFHSTT